MTDYSEVGYYNNANNLSKSLLAIVTSLSAVAIPRISYYASNSNYKEIDILLQKSFSIVSFLSIPMMIGVICVASQFVPLFFGPNFEGSIIPLIIMSGVICVIGFNNITGGQILIGLGCDKLFLKGILTGSVCN
ncbi:oligosaccharide flippase family protein, partial [uncultured Duncaniella sp.]